MEISSGTQEVSSQILLLHVQIRELVRDSKSLAHPGKYVLNQNLNFNKTSRQFAHQNIRNIIGKVDLSCVILSRVGPQ